MNKWLYLFIVWFCWIAVGVMILRADGGGVETGVDQFESPARIVSMAPNLTEILFALGQDEKIVGVTRDSNYPPAAKEKPRVGDFWQMDVEAVISSRPDLVITLGFERQKNLAHRLGRIGYKCLPVNIEKVEDLFEAIRQIGSVTNSQTQADELIGQLGRLRPRRLGILARTTMMKYKDAGRSIERIEAELGVDYLVEGSIRRDGIRVRITASLVRPGDQTGIWTDSSTYDEVTDIFGVQTVAAQRMARMLAAELTIPQRAA